MNRRNNVKALLILAGLAATITASAEITPLQVGDPIPATQLVTAEGESFDLMAAAKEQRLAIIYYRGGWCPYCNTHLGQLQEADAKLRELGYRILAISPDSPQKMKESLDKGHMTYTLLSDSSMETAKAFGIAFEVDKATIKKYEGYGIDLEAASGETHHLLPVPSVFLVGTDGVIDFVHSDENYKVRLQPEALLAAANAAIESDQ
jgi:peroxiredoxin